LDIYLLSKALLASIVFGVYSVEHWGFFRMLLLIMNLRRGYLLMLFHLAILVLLLKTLEP